MPSLVSLLLLLSARTSDTVWFGLVVFSIYDISKRKRLHGFSKFLLPVWCNPVQCNPTKEDVTNIVVNDQNMTNIVVYQQNVTNIKVYEILLNVSHIIQC